MMSEENKISNFVRDIIDGHNEDGRFDGVVHTRFPPEPNGYLHIGHAKSICLNFGIARDYGGKCNLRFDDTNPLKENIEFINAIKEDVRWLGFEWNAELYASDYFQQLYDMAVEMITLRKAYVDDLSADELYEYRGSLTEPGKESPYRNRSVEENLELFEKMKNGEFDEGEKVLRAKIDMSSPIINMRDPVMYRIMKVPHHRTGTDWVIYPTYDWAHGQSDSIEGITHSICTLEFENHRPLYDWYLYAMEIHHPQQIEFARLNLTHTLMSKRKLGVLVEQGLVSGWDDPRLPTISGLRRRGYTPESIRNFCDTIGVAKANSTVEIELLEHTIRDHLNQAAPRAMAVINPLKLTITNFPEDKTEWFEADHYRHDPDRSETRKIPLTREVYIERDDFSEDPPPKYFRMSPGREVRLMGACLVTCTDFVKDNAGNVVEVLCEYDPESLGGQGADGRKVKGTIHWVSVEYGIRAEVRQYEHLFDSPFPEEEEGDFVDQVNVDSLNVIGDAVIEPALKNAEKGQFYQFMRKGYFVLDTVDSSEEKLVFIRTVSLRDSWKKQQKK
jgi:glutaminyl-tRNA synthetase